MELTLGVTLAVLGAALLHAAWNAVIKSCRDVQLDTALVALGSSVVVLPLLPFVSPPAPAAWPWLGASTVIHVGYFTALVGAYRAGDLSHGYPIMRGLAPLFVAASSLAWFDESLSAAAWLGVALISAGVVSLGLVGGRVSRRATLWAAGNAAIIACYTLVDAAGVRAAGGAERYVLWFFAVMGWPYVLIVLAARRGEALPYAGRFWRKGLLAGACAVAAYGIALWAMTRAPVATIAALRETSVIFAALIGAWILKEGQLGPRLGGAAAVLAGVIALKL